MKITKQYLRELIKESMGQIIPQAPISSPRSLKETNGSVIYVVATNDTYDGLSIYGAFSDRETAKRASQKLPDSEVFELPVKNKLNIVKSAAGSLMPYPLNIDW